MPPDSQIITLRNEDLLVPLRSINLLEINDHFEYTEVRFRVRASAIPINDDGSPTVDRVIIRLNDQYHTVIINQWTFHSIPITGSRQRDHFGNIQTEFLRHDTYFDIVGILERETEEVGESESSETAGISSPLYDGRSGEEIEDEEMEEQERIGITLFGYPIVQYLNTIEDVGSLSTAMVACKECLKVMENNNDHIGIHYIINSRDRVGLVICMKCAGLPPKDLAKKPKKKKNLYSRKLRIRRKE